MITLQCTKCKTTMTMDAAFAGGVCRCQHCGTIQTVPSRLRETGASSGAVSQATDTSRSRSAYDRHAAGTGSSLDELGEIIASSGLSSSRLRQAQASQTRSPSAGSPSDLGTTASPGAAGPQSVASHQRMPLIVGGAVAALLVVALMGWLILGGGGETVASQRSRLTDEATGGPQLAGLPLTGTNIIYLLDRGDASREVFGEMKEATYASIASLGRDRRFQIVFWDNGNERAYPPTGTGPAGADAIAGARQALEDVYAFGLAEIRPALRKAMAGEPDEVVIVTAKGYLLDDEFVKTVRSEIGNSNVTVHTIMVGNEELAGPLPALAAAHGGQFRAISVSGLREFARSSGL